MTALSPIKSATLPLANVNAMLDLLQIPMEIAKLVSSITLETENQSFCSLTLEVPMYK